MHIYCAISRYSSLEVNGNRYLIVWWPYPSSILIPVLRTSACDISCFYWSAFIYWNIVYTGLENDKQLWLCIPLFIKKVYFSQPIKRQHIQISIFFGKLKNSFLVSKKYYIIQKIAAYIWCQCTSFVSLYIKMAYHKGYNSC